MTSAVVEQISPVGFCPHCGYDQRGLPSGSCCPECGRFHWPGHFASTMNRWVDGRLLDLWSVAVLQAVGIATSVVAAAATERTQVGAIMLAMFAVVYIVVGTVWYGWVVVSVLRRRRGPAFDHVVGHRRSELSRWIRFDAVLVGAPIAWTLGSGVLF